jgi:hypothetical protein
MIDQPSEERRPGRAARAAGFILKLLLRLLLLLILGSLIGAAFYFGIPWIYRATIVPVQKNTDDIAALMLRMDETSAQVDRVAGALQDRTADMEGEIAGLGEISAVHDRDLAAAVAQVGALEAQVADLQEVTEAQAEAQAGIGKDVDTAARKLTSVESALRDNQEAIEVLEEQLTERLDSVQGQADALSVTQEDLVGRLALLQTAQDLVRVQLLLLEDNPGAARDGLQVAVEHLTRYAALVPGQAVEAAGLAARIQELSTLIAERSFRTATTLEALWADIADMVLPPLPEGSEALPDLTASAVLTATGLLTQTGTLTTTVPLTLTATPTATLTPTPTATPTPNP